MSKKAKISKGAPPTRTYFPLERMEVGEVMSAGKYSMDLYRKAIYAVAYMERKKGQEWQFSVRKIRDGNYDYVKIFRTK